MSRQSFEQKLDAIEALRSAPGSEALESLRRALKDPNNYAVGKAAAVVADCGFATLGPELLAAFDRFLRSPVKSDPQCWAKNAIARALVTLQLSADRVFVGGIVHTQWEPVYGGRQDTAGVLRAICAMGLVESSLAPFEILRYLVDLLNDHDRQVRMEAARAMAQLSAREGTLPLQLKALVGDPEPEVTGACLAALLSLAPKDYLPFVARHLSHEDPDVRIEAAAVLAQSHEPEAFAHVAAFWERQTDAEVKRTLLTWFAASPQDAAAELLLTVIDSAPEAIASEALRALARSRHASRCADRAREAVSIRGNAALSMAFTESFGG